MAQITELSDKTEWYCYFIKSECGKTYVGSTNDIVRRLRQHNGEIVGGAKRTHANRPWSYFAVLTGFPDHINVLSCEWCMKNKTPRNIRGVSGRIKAIETSLEMSQWSSRCLYMNQSLPLKLYILRGIEINVPEWVNKIETDDIATSIINLK